MLIIILSNYQLCPLPLMEIIDIYITACFRCGLNRFSRSNSANQQSISLSCVRIKAVLPLQLLLRLKFRIRPFNFVFELSQIPQTLCSIQRTVILFRDTHASRSVCEFECCFDELLLNNYFVKSNDATLNLNNHKTKSNDSFQLHSILREIEQLGG